MLDFDSVQAIKMDIYQNFDSMYSVYKDKGDMGKAEEIKELESYFDLLFSYKK